MTILLVTTIIKPISDKFGPTCSSNKCEKEQAWCHPNASFHVWSCSEGQLEDLLGAGSAPVASGKASQ
jgi:hypothetical protein